MIHRVVMGGQFLLVGQGGEGQAGIIVLAAQGQPQQVVGKVGVFREQGAVRVVAKDIKENLKLGSLLIVRLTYTETLSKTPDIFYGGFRMVISRDCQGV